MTFSEVFRQSLKSPNLIQDYSTFHSRKQIHLVDCESYWNMLTKKQPRQTSKQGQFRFHTRNLSCLHFSFLATLHFLSFYDSLKNHKSLYPKILFYHSYTMSCSYDAKNLIIDAFFSSTNGTSSSCSHRPNPTLNNERVFLESFHHE